MEDLSIRPGFNLHAAFRGHLSPVRRIAYNAHTKQFLSMDEHCLKAWTVQRDGSTYVHHDVQFPGYQQNFITSMVLSQELNLLFTSCLDDNLRLYNERLRLKSCMPWSNGVVREMVFYEPRSLLVTAGSYGVKVWECLLDYEAFRTDKTSDVYDVPKIKDGSVLPWCFGKYQHVRLRHTLHVPGARLIATTGTPAPNANANASPGGGLRGTTSGSVADSDMTAPGGDGGQVINAPWCDRITLHESTAMVLAMFQGNVYGFDIMNGTCLSSYTGLYIQPVTSCVFVPEADLLFTTAMDTCAVLWRVPRGCEAQRFKQFGRTYSPMTLVCQDPDLKHVLTTSLDGSVTLWDMETLVPVFKMKLSRRPVSTAFYKPNAFFLATETEVKLFTVTHLFEAWMDCNSPAVSLRPLSYGLILAEFADSSVRVLDAHDTSRSDKAVVTTMPQLSSQLLVASAVSLTSARLFALLSDGTVHVWQLHLRRPPSFVAVWTHLMREGGVSLAFLDGGALSAGVSHRLVLPYDHATGLTHDHLMLGTNTGDCILVDITSGHISFRFPAYKHQPLQILAPDLDRGILVTVSRNTIKIWNLLEVRCLHELHTSRPVTRLELLEGRAIAGTVSGSVHVMELHTGAANAASVTVDHMDAVTGIGPSVYLQHVVTGSKDSHIKVFDRDKRFKRSIYMGAPVSAVCYLNDQGDILAAMGQRLVVIRVDKYDRLPSAPKESLYDELRGQGRSPRTLMRSMRCRLQHLSRCKVPLQLYAAMADEGDAGSDSTRRRTPPLRRLQTTALNASAVVDRLIHGGGGSGSPGDSTGRSSGADRNMSFIRPRSAQGEGSGGGAGPGAAGRPMSQGAVEAGSEGVRSALKTPESGSQSRRAGAGPSPHSGMRSVQWLAGQGPGHSISPALAALPMKAVRSPSASASASPPSSPPPAGGGRTSSPGMEKGRDRDGEREKDKERDPRSSCSGLDVSLVKSEDEDEGRVIAREMYPLVYNYNLHKEKMRLDRLIHGLPSIRRQPPPAEPPAQSRPSSKDSKESREAADGAATGPGGASAAAAGGGAVGSRASGGAPPPLAMRLSSLRHGLVPEAAEKSEESAAEEGSDESDGPDFSSGTASASVSEGEASCAQAGLSAAFRRTLPIIASPSAFFDGHVPAEAMPRAKKKGCGGAAGKKTVGSTSSKGKVDASTTSVYAPSGDGDSAAAASATAAAAAEAEAVRKAAKKAKKKKKKKRRRRVLMNADLAAQLKAGLDYEIRAEVKAWEKHQTVQRLATAIFLPPLSPPAGAAGIAARSPSPQVSCTATSVSGGGGAPTDAESTAAAPSAACPSGSGGGHALVGGAPSFKAMLKGLGVRGNVADIARMIGDPKGFVVATEQGKRQGAGAGSVDGAGSGAGRTPPRLSSPGGVNESKPKKVTVVEAGGRAVQGDAAGAAPAGGKESGDRPVRRKSLLAPGNFGLQAFMELQRQRFGEMGSLG